MKKIYEKPALDTIEFKIAERMAVGGGFDYSEGDDVLLPDDE